MAENVIPQPGALVSIDGVGEYRFAAIVDGLAHLHPTDGTEVLIQTQISKLQLVTPNVEWTRPEWDQYFLLIARAVALRGSCRRKKVGAVLVDGERRIVGSGYNGAPRGLPDCLTNGCDVRVIDGRESCVRTLHAESNAIDFANPGANNVTLYTNVIPCRLCALRIIQTRIIRVVYEEHYQSQGTPEVPGLFKVAGIPLDHVPLP